MVVRSRTILAIFVAYSLTLIAVAAQKRGSIISATTSEDKWPRFVVAERHSNSNNVTIRMISPKSDKTISPISTNASHRGLTVNAHSGKICYLYPATFGIMCHINGNPLIPDIPRSKYYKEGHGVMSLSPYGDHLIFQEVNKGGVWIFNFQTQKTRLLILPVSGRFGFLQVDWDHGYLLTRPAERESRHKIDSIQVWELVGNSFAQKHGRVEVGYSDTIYGFAINANTKSCYIATAKHVLEAKYHLFLAVPTSIKENVFTTSTSGAGLLRYYKNALFWSEDYVRDVSNKKQLQGFSRKIYRLNLGPRTIDEETYTVLDKQATEAAIDQMEVFEDDTDVKEKSNPCTKCSHICIPHKSKARYECGCPFGQPLLKTPSKLGIQTQCKMHLNVSVIAVETAKTPAAKLSLQTYDAMEKLDASLKSNNPLSSSNIVLHAEGFCTLEGYNPKLVCFNFTGDFMGEWTLRDRVVRVLTLMEDGAIVWFNGTCVKHRAKKWTWIIYCDPGIDPENIVLDHINWFLFYLNVPSTEIRLVHLVVSNTPYGLGIWSSPKPMRMAVDMSNGILYYFVGPSLFKLSYKYYASAVKHDILFDLDRRLFQDQQLRFAKGMLYWVEVRPKDQNTTQHVVVRFDPITETLETYVEAPSSYKIMSFDVEVPRTKLEPLKCWNHKGEECFHCYFLQQYQCWHPPREEVDSNHVSGTTAKRDTTSTTGETTTTTEAPKVRESTTPTPDPRGNKTCESTTVATDAPNLKQKPTTAPGNQINKANGTTTTAIYVLESTTDAPDPEEASSSGTGPSEFTTETLPMTVNPVTATTAQVPQETEPTKSPDVNLESARNLSIHNTGNSRTVTVGATGSQAQSVQKPAPKYNLPVGVVITTIVFSVILFFGYIVLVRLLRPPSIVLRPDTSVGQNSQHVVVTPL